MKVKKFRLGTTCIQTSILQTISIQIKQHKTNRNVLLHKNTIQGIFQSFSLLVVANIILCFW